MSSLLYDTLCAGAAGGFSRAACVESRDGPNTTATDLSTPAFRQAFFYLTRAQSVCSEGVGSLGTDSAGNEHLGAAYP